VQQVRKQKRAPRSRMAAGKHARNRSADQMLVELKQRFREISDLNAAVATDVRFRR